MKKLLVAFIVIICVAAPGFSQEGSELKLTIGGEARTGFFAWWKELGIYSPNYDYGNSTGALLPDEGADIHYSEFDDWMLTRRIDATKGTNQGLYRINFQVEKGNIGAKFRFQMQDFNVGGVTWAYAYLYGSFFDDQFRASAGRLGDSPWGTGEEELDKELDNTVGMRFEFLPSFVPGLDLGFTLNNYNTTLSSGVTSGLKDLVSETVFGISYTNDYFHGRFSYRLDSEADNEGSSNWDQGGRLAYRLEERVLGNYLPGLRVWNVGYFEEIGNDKREHPLRGANLLYAMYDPDNFTARLRLGYHIIDVGRLPLGSRVNKSRQWISIQPSFYYKFFNNFLFTGIAFEFAKDFGDGLVADSPYLSWYIEPQIRLNVGQGFYISFVYRYQDDYYLMDIDNDPVNPVIYNSNTHWVNLRMVFTF